MVYSYKDLKKAKISGASDAIPEVKKKPAKFTLHQKLSKTNTRVENKRNERQVDN